MSCLFPLAGFRDLDGNFYLQPHGTLEYVTPHGQILTNPIDVPCGKCVECRIDNVMSWKSRLIMESLYHERSCFVTLTYDDGHLPLNEFGLNTLDKRDIQLFIKRLRKAYPDNNIRYYFCGEYGPKTNRPHYHGIIFGWMPDDGELWRTDNAGHLAYKSVELSRLWQHRGYVEYSDCNPSTMSYCCSYVLKKLKGATGRTYYDEHKLVPPFSLASRRPAIGSRYIDDFAADGKSLFDSHYVSTDRGAYKLRFGVYAKARLKRLSDQYVSECLDLQSRPRPDDDVRIINARNPEVLQSGMYDFDSVGVRMQLEHIRERTKTSVNNRDCI